MICGFVTPSSWMHPSHTKNNCLKVAPLSLRAQATTSAVNRMRTVTYLPTAIEAIVVNKHKVVAPPRRHPPPEPDRQEAPSIPGSSVPDFKCGRRKIRRHVADHQYPWSSGGLSRRFTLVILRVQVSEHGEYTEMQKSLRSLVGSNVQSKGISVRPRRSR
ncbi:hypothetical protein BGY98DRAFT_717163 [Russula aff. rugulosa BPL654]|nr:hypothetical protein BGY98DRAFT_717163 [Russula aff. rugulosa BPL654]